MLQRDLVTREWQCTGCELRLLDGYRLVGNCGSVQEILNNGSVEYRCSFLPGVERHIYSVGRKIGHGVREVATHHALKTCPRVLEHYNAA